MFEPLRLRVVAQLLGPKGLTRKLLAIVAPVGYGKTVLMSVLLADLRRRGKQCLWLTLDERDGGVDAVMGGLMAQLQGVDADPRPAQILLGGDQPVEQGITALIERLNGHPLPVTVFIDNLNHCTDPALGELLDRLCFDTVPTVQFALSSTREIPLNVSRALLEGLMRKVGIADLGFRADDVATLFGAPLCERIGSEGVAQVAQQIEGWPAAARMAQIVLSGSERPAEALSGFKGSDEGLAHLLNRQVLSGFSPKARAFLLALAQLRSFSAELCREASGDPEAQSYLDDLVRRNVFIIPLDRNQQWYRLHSLFREYLLGESERAMDDASRRAVLQRASAWCERNGYWREAVDYALAARACDKACEVLQRIAAAYVRERGDARQLIDWVEHLHREGRTPGPEVGFWFAWALAFCRRYDDARHHIHRLTLALEQQAPREQALPQTGELRRRIAILQASVDCLTDHLPEAHAGAVAWLEGAGSQDDAFNVTAAHCIQSVYHASHFRFVEARRAIERARESAFQAHSGYVDGWVSAYAALSPIYEGNHAEAYPALVAALAAARSSLGDAGGIGGTLALMAAKCAIEMGLDSEAHELLRQGMQSSRTHGFLEAAACGLDAAVAVWDGSDDALLSVDSLRSIAATYPPRLSQVLSCFLVRRFLSLGRRDEARAESERLGLRGDGAASQALECLQVAQTRDLCTSTQLEMMVDAGRARQATTLATAELAAARENGLAARSVELLLVLCRLASGAGNATLARRHLVQAVRLACPRRIVRPFVLQAGAIEAALADTRPEGLGFAKSEEQRFFLDIWARLPARATDEDVAAAPARGLVQALGSLTPRELEMLRLIEAGLGNQQIADQIGVSLTTIKWHLQNLYGKLGVSSRSAALARAKGLNLLAR